MHGREDAPLEWRVSHEHTDGKPHGAPAVDGVKGARILIVELRYYPEIADALISGADARDHEERRARPSAWSCPARSRSRAPSRSRPSRYDGFLALGCVIRGETTHYDYVCGESARGLMDLSVHKKLAIGYGIVTVNTMEQAKARAETHRGDKGGDAAHACLAMVALQRRWRNS